MRRLKFPFSDNLPPVKGDSVGVFPFTGEHVTSSKFSSISVVGDSISQRWFTSSATADQTNSYGFLTWARILSGGKINILASYAVGGAKVVSASGESIISITRQMNLAEVDASDTIFCLGGINDFQSGASVHTVISGLIEIYKRAFQSGKTIVFFTVLPVESTYSGYSTDLQTKVMQLNRWFNSVATGFSNCIVVDIFSSFADLASATASGKSGFSVDGIHPSNRGAYFIGKRVAQQLDKYLPPAPVYVSCAADHKGYNSANENTISNPLMTSGSPVATGFVVVNSGGAGNTPSIVSRGDGSNWQQVAATGASNNDSVSIRPGSPTAFFSVASKIQASCDFVLLNPVNVKGVRLVLTITGTSGSYILTDSFIDTTNDIAFTEGFSGKFLTPLGVIPASVGTVSNVQISANVMFAGPGSATFQVGSFCVLNPS